MKFKFFLILFVFTANLLLARLIIGEINFNGNSFIAGGELRKVIFSSSGSEYDQKTINDDVKKIVEYYAEQGYYHIKVAMPTLETSNPQNIRVDFHINEFSRLVIDSLQIKGNNYIGEDKIYANFQAGVNNLNQLNNFIKRTAEFYTEQGFYFAKVKLDSVKKVENRLNAFITIDEGDYCEFDKFVFEGNKVTRDKTILQITGLDRQVKITPEIIEFARELLEQKQYIKSAVILPLNPSTLLIRIEETRMSLFSGIAGYNSREEDKQLTGYLDLNFMNLFGTDRGVELHWQRLSEFSSYIEMSYHEPGLYAFPLSADFSIYREEVDSTYIESSFDAEVYYHNFKNKYGLYFAYDDIFPGTRRPKVIEKTNFTKIGVFWYYNNVKNRYNPRNSMDVRSKYYYIFNRVETESVRKQAVEISYSKYFPLSRALVAAVSLQTNLIENKQITEFELYDLGGFNNLRGFMEKRFQGYRVGWSNLELRYLLSKQSRVFIFSDYGYVKNNTYTYGKLFSAGFGLRLETRLGLLGIDYGVKYFNEWDNPLDGVIHFGLETGL